MYDMNDLFNYRDVVGCKLNQIIGSHKYTKSNVCTGAGISRPTLDKLLNGEVTNKTNFEKHISKLLAFLSLTPSELMGGIANPFTDSKTLRDALRLDLQQLSQRCGLSIDELQKIEAGEDVPLAELRDVAYCLGTGVTGVLGDGYFQTLVSSMDYFVKNDPTTIQSPGGFWGHLGILVQGQPKYLWFPITAYTRQLVYKNSTEKYMAIPCMDNSLLLINCDRIEELVLLDEACDSPVDMDWDSTVSEGEIPAVVYEAFDDYMTYKDVGDTPSHYDLSALLVGAIDHIIDICKIDSKAFASKLNTATIIFSNGRILYQCELVQNTLFFYFRGNFCALQILFKILIQNSAVRVALQCVTRQLIQIKAVFFFPQCKKNCRYNKRLFIFSKPAVIPQIFVKFLCLLQNVSKFNIFRRRFLKYNLLVIFHNMCC